MQVGSAHDHPLWRALGGGGRGGKLLPPDPGAIAGLGWKRMRGLLPAIIQDDHSGRLLGIGLMDEPALRRTLESGLVNLPARRSQQLLGAKCRPLSGLHVQAIYASSDAAALLLLVEKQPCECATPIASCFDVLPRGPGWLAELARSIADATNPQRLPAHFDLQRLAQDLGEQSVDVAIAGLCRDSEACRCEIARLLLLLTSLIHARGLDWREIIAELQSQYAARCELTKSSADQQ